MNRKKDVLSDWKLAAFVIVLAAPLAMAAQPLEVNNAPPITPNNLITNVFLGEGVEVLDVQFEGSAAAVGLFQNGEDEIGLSRGIVMSTGFASATPGRIGVDSPGAAQSSEVVSGSTPDPDMEQLSSTGDINDLVAYTITFVPISDTLRFRYVFASEEYPEYVCSEFNDVFGFFISGPGINGPFSNNAQNIALIPETNLPVAINNVNPGVAGANGAAENCMPPGGSLDFAQYYNSNNGSSGRPVFDGFTSVFTAEAVVIPCNTYTIRLVICDVTDELFDSGVFLEAKSFGTGSLKVETATASLDGSVAEGCTQGELTFSLPKPAESDYFIDYNILGTAENGVDYAFIPSGLFIPAGDSVLAIPVAAFQDGLAEGTETLVVDVQLDLCNRDTIIIPIRERVLISPSLRPDTTLCRGDTLPLDGRVDVPLPPPRTFYNEDTLVISPHNVTLYSDIEVFGVLPATLGPGVIRSVCIEDLRTTWVDDLRIFLIAPGGQFMELVTDIGNSGDNFTGTCFTPLATTRITGLSAADQPFTGAFAPEGFWEDLYGDDSPTNGTWQLALLDKFAADVPVLNRWSITFTPLYEIGYAWQPAGGLSCPECPGPAAAPDTTTSYILTATDSYGCASYDTVTLEILPVLEAPEVVCAAVAASSITVSWGDVPGAAGYEVNIDSAGWAPANGANEHTVDGLFLATTVQVQVRAVGPCGSIAASIECTTPDCTPPAPQVASVTDAFCFGGADGSLALTASGGTPPYQFILNGETNDTGVFDSLPAGTYLAQVVDDVGCPASVQAVIGQPPPLPATLSTDSVSCAGRADGRAAVEINGGNGPFAFSWSDGQADSIATGLAAGAYQLTVTDANGCSYSYEARVGEPEPLLLTVETDAARCAGAANGMATATASGGAGSYGFDFGPGVIIGTVPNRAVGLAAGSYEVTVTDGNGCETVAGYLIEEPPALQVQLAVMDALCADSASAMVSAAVSGGTGGYAYTWLDAAMDTVGQAAVLSGVPAGQYFVEISDANNCLLVEEAVPGEPPPLDYALDVQPASCSGGADGSASLLVAGGAPGYFYNWSDTGDGPATRDGLPVGNYTVTVTDQNACALEIGIEVGSPPAIGLSFSTQPTSCPGNADGQATVTAEGGVPPYAYSWAGGQATPTAIGLGAGAVSVTVTDTNGCEAAGTATVEEAPAINVSAEGTGPLCHGENNGTATAAAQGGAGGFSYLWSNGQTATTATGLAAGAHAVTVTDGNGCAATATLELEEPMPLLGTITTIDATCDPAPGGSATALIQGGTPPYSYAWNDGQSQPSATNLPMGIYMLTVTDANGCVLADTAEVGGIPAISLQLEGRDVSCNGGADGAVAAVAEGGVGSYAFSWSNGSSGAQAIGLAAGAYSVTVSDGIGCTATESLLIGEPPALALETREGRVSCAGDRDGSISVAIEGGTTPYSILWNTGDTAPAVTGLSVGAYFVTVTDANGCRATRETQVVEFSPIEISAETGEARCFGEANGSAAVRASGGMPPYSFSWPGGTTGPALDDVPAGTYILSVTDAAGCEVTEEIAVGQPDAPLSAAINPADASCFGRADGRLEILASGGSPPYRYSLDGDFYSGNNTFIGLVPGSYPVRIRDARECFLLAGPATVGEPAPIEVDLGDTRAAAYGESIRLQPAVAGGVGELAFSWQPADSSLLSCLDCREPLVAVTYQASIKVTVTDENGCSGEDIVTVYPRKERPVFVPSGFSPNGDGNNDRLLVHAREDLEAQVLYFRVFDRWGELLHEANQFEPNDENAGWDGTFRGQPAPGGVYIWHLGVEFADGNREEFSGHATLIR